MLMLSEKQFLRNLLRGGDRKVILLTQEIKSKLPVLYTQENEEDPMVICKFFAVFTNWTWYGIEFDGNDTFFGYVAGDFPELGYFTLSELQELKGPMGLTIERDMYFKPCRLSEIKKLQERKV